MTARAPLHLEDHLDVARFEGSGLPEKTRDAIVWRSDSLRKAWKRVYPFEHDVEPASVNWAGEALRLTFDERHRDSEGELIGAISVELEDRKLEEWQYLAVTVRAEPGAGVIAPAFNLTEPTWPGGFGASGQQLDLLDDGTEQTYLLELDQVLWGAYPAPWRELGIWVSAERATKVEITSVTLIPAEASYASSAFGLVTEASGSEFRRSVFVHAPSRLEYHVRLPEGARLDVGLGVVRGDAAYEFAIDVRGENGEARTLLRETYSEVDRWAQRSVDLSDLAGQVVTLGLAVSSDLPGSVALWASPTLSGSEKLTPSRPNVILYVIDGASAASMSLYGYPRRTTPHLERLAEEGTVFDYAYSNASWTRPSTASFLTSRYHSTLGGAVNGRTWVPAEVPTAAELLHRTGYQTAFLTTNANAGRMSGLDRGVDFMREAWVEDNRSSERLQDDFWRWRKAYPATPYWVHFQPTDVHSPNLPVEPFAGLWASPERRAQRVRWEDELEQSPVLRSASTPYSDGFDIAGIDRITFFTAYRDTHDETMAQQDAHIGQLVRRLKASGEWHNTLLIVAADHGHQAGTRHFGLGMLDPLPPIWDGAMLTSFQTRIPMLFVWPGHIEAGAHIEGPASMLDVLPTVLELLDLPVPEGIQGRSLAPVLRGEEPWQARKVFLDEFSIDRETGQLRGQIDVIDGRWGASLYVGPPRPDGWIHLRGHRAIPPPNSTFRLGVPEETPRLLLFDLWDDERGVQSVREPHPDLVEEYSRLLEAELRRHMAEGAELHREEPGALTSEQLSTLRALGYIR